MIFRVSYNRGIPLYALYFCVPQFYCKKMLIFVFLLWFFDCLKMHCMFYFAWKIYRFFLASPVIFLIRFLLAPHIEAQYGLCFWTFPGFRLPGFFTTWKILWYFHSVLHWVLSFEFISFSFFACIYFLLLICLWYPLHLLGFFHLTLVAQKGKFTKLFWGCVWKPVYLCISNYETKCRNTSAPNVALS